MRRLEGVWQAPSEVPWEPGGTGRLVRALSGVTQASLKEYTALMYAGANAISRTRKDSEPRSSDLGDVFSPFSGQDGKGEALAILTGFGGCRWRQKYNLKTRAGRVRLFEPVVRPRQVKDAHEIEAAFARLESVFVESVPMQARPLA